MLETEQCRHKPGATLFHQTSTFLVHDRAMFNRIHPRAHGGFDALSAFGVGHHFLACTMGDLDCLRHLLLAEFLHAVVTDRIHNSTGGHELDPVGSIFNVAASDAADFVYRVSDVRTMQKPSIGS